MRNFRNYRVWKQAMLIVHEVYTVSKLLPREEQYVLAAQLRKSAVSIPSNIAEGCGRETDKEFRRFLEIALSSAFELETQLLLADSLFGLGKHECYQNGMRMLGELQPAINALMQTLNDS